jgi:hypothetical protein
MKRKKFNAGKELKAIARERLGSPKPSRPIEPKPPGRKAKHKKSDLLYYGQTISSGYPPDRA